MAVWPPGSSMQVSCHFCLVLHQDDALVLSLEEMGFKYWPAFLGSLLCSSSVSWDASKQISEKNRVTLQNATIIILPSLQVLFHSIPNSTITDHYSQGCPQPVHYRGLSCWLVQGWAAHQPLWEHPIIYTTQTA